MQRAVERTPAGKSLDLQRYIPALVSILENKLTNSASSVYRENFGIGATEMRIIVQLGNQSSMSGNQIGQAIALDKAAVSRALKSLEALGLIDICAGHGRRRAVALTRAGETLHARGVAISLLREERLLEGFSAAEREVLIAFLNRMLGNMSLVGAVVSPRSTAAAKRRASSAVRG